MIIFKQKEFTSPKLKLKARLETTKRNARFLGRLGKLTGKSVIETTNVEGLNGPYGTLSNVGKDILNENRKTLRFFKNTADKLGSKETPLKQKVGIAANIVTDLNPKTAFGKHLAGEVYHVSGKNGTGVVKSMAEFATNPAKKTGSIMADFRQGGHGGNVGLAGAWIGPGTNQYCLGFAPDTIISGVGSRYEAYKGSQNLADQVTSIVNSKDGRRFARSYDRTIGRVVSPIHKAVSKVVNKVV